MAEARPVVCSKGRFDLVSQRVEGRKKEEKRKEKERKGGGKKEVKGVEIPFSS